MIRAPRRGRKWFRPRFREPSFWAVQVGVLFVTAAHLGLEVLPFDLHRVSIVHVPVFLYILPISYAGYRYGLEGGVLTGVWTAIVAAPNSVLFHRANYEWIGELAHVLVVVTVAVLVAIPVERERRARERAEDGSERLSLLNSVIATLGESPDVQHSLTATLHRLVAVMHLAGAAVDLGEGDVEGARVLAADGARGEEAARIARIGSGDGLFPVVVDSARIGQLAVVSGDGLLAADDRDTLEAAAGYIGVAFENALLHAREKRMLRSYAAQVTRVQEDERTRMARELHDEIAQELIVLAREVEAVEDDGCLGVAERARSILSSVRRFSRDLRPAVLDDLGLVAAVRWLATDLTERTGLLVEVCIEGSPRRSSPEVELALFRIVQEALRNADRHAGAQHVAIVLAFLADRVTVRVRDDGGGFAVDSPAELARRGSYGILGMHERAHLVDGSFSVHSQPGRGTEIEVAVPVGQT